MVDIVKGWARLLYRKNGSKRVEGAADIVSLCREDYEEALPSGIPLQEINTAFDVYEMYKDGVYRFSYVGDLEGGGSSTAISELREEVLFELSRPIQNGDLITLETTGGPDVRVYGIMIPGEIPDEVIDCFQAYQPPGSRVAVADLGLHMNFNGRKASQ